MEYLIDSKLGSIFLNIDWTEVLLGIIAAAGAYATGYRKGRKIHRSGDYIQFGTRAGEDDETK